MLRQIKNALISVSDKDELLKILKILDRFKVKIISLFDNSAKQIIKLGYKCEEISKYTGFKEMLDGRVFLFFIQKFTQVFCMIDPIKNTWVK